MHRPVPRLGPRKSVLSLDSLVPAVSMAHSATVEKVLQSLVPAGGDAEPLAVACPSAHAGGNVDRNSAGRRKELREPCQLREFLTTPPSSSVFGVDQACPDAQLRDELRACLQDKLGDTVPAEFLRAMRSNEERKDCCLAMAEVMRASASSLPATLQPLVATYAEAEADALVTWLVDVRWPVRTCSELGREWQRTPRSAKQRWEDEAASLQHEYREALYDYSKSRREKPKIPLSAYFLWVQHLRAAGCLAPTRAV